MDACSMSFSRKAPRDRSRISSTAEESTASSAAAPEVNESFLSCISSADSSRFTAWSEMRSISPMTFSSFAASWLSASLMGLALSFTR